MKNKIIYETGKVAFDYNKFFEAIQNGEKIIKKVVNKYHVIIMADPTNEERLPHDDDDIEEIDIALSTFHKDFLSKIGKMVDPSYRVTVLACTNDSWWGK